MHGAVSRLHGSPTTAAAGSSGNCSRTAVDQPLVRDDHPPLVRHQIAQPIDRLAEHRRVADQPQQLLGRVVRLAGQNRVPVPPAMMIA